MNNIKISVLALLCVCAILLVSCGNVEETTSNSASAVVKGAAESESQMEEEQPYEILRAKEETKTIAVDEEQQTKELKDALNEFEFFYTEADGAGDILMGMSPHCDEAAEKGKSCILPLLYIMGPSTDPVIVIGFNYITDEYMNIDTVEIDTDNYRYTCEITDETQKVKITINNGQTEKLDEVAAHLATEDDLDTLVDIIDSSKVRLTFAKYNTAKPDLFECEMPEEDKQAITDTLNAYYLYLNASEKVRAKALADLETIETE